LGASPNWLVPDEEEKKMPQAITSAHSKSLHSAITYSETPNWEIKEEMIYEDEF
jgi:hypothetical protein